MTNKTIPAIIIVMVVLVAGAFRSRIDFGLNAATVIYFALLSALAIPAFRSLRQKPGARFWIYLGVYLFCCAALALYLAL